MKALVINISFILFSTSCGYQQTLREHCRIGDTQTCDNIFGRNQADIDETQNARLKQNEAEILTLTTVVNGLIADIKQVEQNLSQTITMINLVNTLLLQQGADIDILNQMLVDLDQDVVIIQNNIAYEQARINSLQIDIAQLQQQDSVVETVYPCGDNPNKFDEGLLKMKSGKLIAYFESGSNRFLTVLSSGAYRTTDYSPYCNFSINAQNQIINAIRSN